MIICCVFSFYLLKFNLFCVTVKNPWWLIVSSNYMTSSLFFFFFFPALSWTAKLDCKKLIFFLHVGQILNLKLDRKLNLLDPFVYNNYNINFHVCGVIFSPLHTCPNWVVNLNARWVRIPLSNYHWKGNSGSRVSRESRHAQMIGGNFKGWFIGCWF